MTDPEFMELVVAVKASAPRVPAEQIRIEAKARSQFSEAELKTHDWIYTMHEGMRELAIDEDQIPAAMDLIVKRTLGENAEQAEATYAKIEKAIAETY